MQIQQVHPVAGLDGNVGDEIGFVRDGQLGPSSQEPPPAGEEIVNGRHEVGDAAGRATVETRSKGGRPEGIRIERRHWIVDRDFWRTSDRIVRGDPLAWLE